MNINLRRIMQFLKDKSFQDKRNYLGIIILTAVLMLTACGDDDFGEINTGQSPYLSGAGVFVINEGNFGSGNGSLSFIHIDSMTIANDIFYSANNRPIGDVPYTMLLMEEELWVAVNNSGRIEVLSLHDLKTVAVIDGLVSPRFMLQVSGQKVYVSDLYSDRITIISRDTYQVLGSVAAGRSTENLVMAGGKVFAAFWSNYSYPGLENNQVLVIDPAIDMVVDSIEVGKEPNSMAVDKSGRLWVLCSGGFMGETYPALWSIDPQNLESEQVITFPEINSSPGSLRTNGNADTLFFLNQGVFAVAVDEPVLSGQPVIKMQDGLFYGLGVDPVNSWIFVSDAIDYQQRGLVKMFNSKGEPIHTFTAGIIPGSFWFN
jgi:YVTN family beta-propeller protein